MNLRKVAASFETTQFDAYNEGSDTWTACAMAGKVMPLDRFLSNFNRPTKRRSLGVSPTAVPPDSNTLRVPATGAIYMMGELRKDSQSSVAYDQVGILHRSTTLGTINRRAPAGPAEDPGWLVETEIASHYMDMELRSASEIDEHEQRYDGSYFAVMPPHAQMQSWDRLNADGFDYIVQVQYMDSGFRFARVVNRIDPRKDFVYNSQGGTAGYDPSTRIVTDGFTAYNVTGFALGQGLTESRESSTQDADLVVIVDQANIGVVPTPRDELTWDGQAYKVTKVEEDFIETQYKIHCSL